MARKVNVRFLAWTLIVCILCIVGVYLLHQYQLHRNANTLLEHAEKALAEKQFHKAAFFLKNYLTYKPDDDEAFIEYALTLDKIAESNGGDYRTFLFVEHALRRVPDDLRLRKKAAQLALEMFRFESAEYHIRLLLKEDANDDQVWQNLAVCQEGLGEYEQAKASFEKAIALNPHDLMHYARLANLLRFDLEQHNEVISVLDQMVAANPKAYKAYLTRAHHFRRTEATEKAWLDAQKAEQLAPDEIPVLLTVAALAEDTGRTDKTREVLERGILKHPKEEEFYVMLAESENRQARKEQAISCLKKGLQAIPTSSRLRILLTDLFVEQGDLSEAQKYLGKLTGDKSSTEAVKCLQARLYAQQQNWQKALAIITELRGKLSKQSPWRAQAEYVAGICYEHLGNNAEAVIAYKKAVAASRSWPQARLKYANALMTVGRYAEAIPQCREVLEYPNAPPEAGLLLAQVLTQQFRRSPQLADWFEVDLLLAQAAQNDANPVRLALVKADSLSARGRFKDAKAALLSAEKAHPKNLEVALGLADLYSRHHAEKAALEQWKKVKQTFGDSLQLQQSRMWYWVCLGGKQATQKLTEMANEDMKLSKDDRLRFLRELAAALYRLEEPNRAADIWRQIAKLYSQDLPSRFSLFDLALRRNDLSTAQSVLKQIRQVEGKAGRLGRFGEAALLVAGANGPEDSRYRQALKLLDEVAALKPDWGRIYLLRGFIAERRQQPEVAAQQYLLALEKGEPQLRALEKAIRYFYDRQQFRKAEELLNKLGDKVLLSQELAKLTVRVAIYFHNYQRAHDVVAYCVNPDSRDYREHLWLAGTYRRLELLSHAEQAYRRAIRTAPYVPETWAGLVRLLHETGAKEQVEKILKDVPKKVSAKNIPFTMARCYEESGQVAKAEDTLVKLHAKRPNDFLIVNQLADFYERQQQPQKAEPWLRKLAMPQHPVPVRVIFSARLRLAKTLAHQGGKEHYDEALKLIEANKQVRSDIRDRIALAQVLAYKPENKQQAIRLLEQARKQTPLDADALFTLAKLYKDSQRYSQAMASISRLMNLEGDKPEYLALYVQVLLANHDVATALLYLERLEGLEPNVLRTIQLRKQWNKTKAENDAEQAY